MAEAAKQGAIELRDLAEQMLRLEKAQLAARDAAVAKAIADVPGGCEPNGWANVVHVLAADVVERFRDISGADQGATIAAHASMWASFKIGNIEVGVVSGAVMRENGTGEVLIIGDVAEEDVARALLRGWRLQVERPAEPPP